MRDDQPPHPQTPAGAHLRLWLCVLAALLLVALPAPRAPEPGGPQVAVAGHAAILALPAHDTAARIEVAQMRPLPLHAILSAAPPVSRPRVVAAAKFIPPIPRPAGDLRIARRARAPPLPSRTV